MTALQQDRITRSRSLPGAPMPGAIFLPIADAVVIYAGALVVQDTAGNARPGRASTTDVAIGMARHRFDNTGTGHAARATGFTIGPVEIELGVFGFDNDASNPVVDTTQMGTKLYVVDDHTVSLSSNGSSRIVAGRLWSLDEDGSGQVLVIMSPLCGFPT